MWIAAASLLGPCAVSTTYLPTDALNHRNTPHSPNRICSIARSDQRIDLISTPWPTPDALLTAIAFLAIHTDPNSTLVISPDSDSATRSLCYDVGPAYGGRERPALISDFWSLILARVNCLRPHAR